MFKSETNPKAKLTPTQILEIKNLIKKGIPGKEIAKEYNISPSAISRIKQNKTWKGVK